MIDEEADGERRKEERMARDDPEGLRKLKRERKAQQYFLGTGVMDLITFWRWGGCRKAQK